MRGLRLRWAYVAGIVALAVVAAGGTWLVGDASAGTATARSFTPTGRWEWADGPSLGTTSAVDQSASATGSGGTRGPSTTAPMSAPAATRTTRPPAAGAWLSGAASQYAADGSFGAWRGEPVTIGGTWDDSLEEQTALDSLTVGDWKNWTGALDEAIGAIWKSNGESWAQAAAGAYDGRWTTALTNLRAAWGSRDPAKLYIRFAHEMNGTWTAWNVQPGEEADFRAALTRFSALRYAILPRANIVLCPNDGTSTGIDVRTLFVARDTQGRRVVNVYSTDTYNQYPHRTDYADIMSSFGATSGSGAPVGIEAHREFAQSVGVPFAVSEWGNCGVASDCDGGGGEAPAYVRAFNAWTRSHAGSLGSPVAGQVLYEVQFNLWDRFLLYPVSLQPATATAYAGLVWGR